MIARAKLMSDPVTTIGTIVNNIPYNRRTAKEMRHKLLMKYPQAQFVEIGEPTKSDIMYELREKVKLLTNKLTE